MGIWQALEVSAKHYLYSERDWSAAAIEAIKHFAWHEAHDVQDGLGRPRAGHTGAWSSSPMRS